MPGSTIEVPWPAGKVIVDPTKPSWDGTLGATKQEIFSADPNDHYRPWLEEHAGRQGWDWNWRMGTIATQTGMTDTLIIKFRTKKAKYATIAAMRWA
jgi:hypothetical protein